VKLIWWFRSDGDTVTPVLGPEEGHPGRDCSGVPIFANTHFRTAEEAWDQTAAECAAGMTLAAEECSRLESRLDATRADLQRHAQTWVAIRQRRGENPG
jgi:hypothetical protein